MAKKQQDTKKKAVMVAASMESQDPTVTDPRDDEEDDEEDEDEVGGPDAIEAPSTDERGVNLPGVEEEPTGGEATAKGKSAKSVGPGLQSALSYQDNHVPNTVPVGAVNVSGASWAIARAWALQAGMYWNIADRVLLAAEKAGKVFTTPVIGSATAPATLIATLRPFFAAQGEYAEQADNYVAQCSTDPVTGLSLV